ncbi:hypothetical protein [Flavobacterium seoulense]|uniref:TonB-dependent receptor n=1 Tax=Flavobacterium seoulense TaxID=1492738 RepID=A0A066WSL4_9FLAO|nr:hypothetical protein [Flavobacterium seoulense]KDN55573.1 hypothetical protein FEM21_11750 [Flavobacterium seoulense]
MIRFFLKSKKCTLASLFLVVMSFGFLQAQDKNTIPDIEKVYLHTDRSTYFMGEDLWYKAYNVRASNNLLFDNSNILYVELISSDSKIIARNKTNLEMGLGHGDFQLQDSLDVKPGKYQLRAYTNWNRNFGNDFVFKKEIEVIDVFESNDKSKTPKNISEVTTKSKKQATKQNTFKVDFFPEGGSLLENVSSIVGFKAVDVNGKPIDIKGEIYDSNDELVTTFTSAHDGMGKFQILPMEGKSYYAKIKSPSGEEVKIELPNVLKQGYLVSFKAIKGKNIISISTNQVTLSQNPNPTLTVICKIKGIHYLETAQTLTENTLSFELPKEKTPEGISQITIYDSNNKPQSERLIYIEKEQDLEVELSTDNDIYEPKEKAIVYISSKSKEGLVKSANFSLSVTDTNGVEDKDFDSNICSYFLMESDIRAKVYHPAYYFDTNNPNRLEHLDNLLLTQGWRDFIWKRLSKANEITNYKAEKGITISGRVKQLLGDKSLINSSLTLALINEKNQYIFSSTTDSIGRFKFKNLMFSEMTNMYLSTTNEKGNFRGEIVLDSIEKNPISVKLKNEIIGFPATNKSIIENVFKKYTALGVKSENILKEVEVKAIEKKNRNPDFSFLVDKKDANRFYSFFEYLIHKLKINVPVIFESNRSFEIKIDNFKLENMNELFSLFPDQVIKVEVIIGNSTSFTPGSNTIITIFTKKINGGQRIASSPLYYVNQKIKGFYTERIFYSPDLENPEIEVDNMTNLRNTIYWNPDINPDETGETSVDFYNTNVETKVKVALEGITANGIPVVKTTYYTIKK